MSEGVAKQVWFDQGHDQQEWNTPPFSGPIPVIEEYGYRAAKQCAEQAGYQVRALSRAITDQGDLANCDLLVMVAPWHALLQPWEIDNIARFVENGKGLLVMSYYTGDPHHQNNLSELGRKVGVEFRTDQVVDPVHHYTDRFGILVEGIPQEHEIFQGVHRLCFNTTCSLNVTNPDKVLVLLRSGHGSFTREADVNKRGKIMSWEPTANTEVPLLAVANYGAGRFAAIGTWEIFLSEYMESAELDNRQLYLNLLRWLTAGQGVMVEGSDWTAAAAQAVPSGLNYERGLQSLKELLKQHLPTLQSDFETLEYRLLDNLRTAELHGSTEIVRAERARVVDSLNRLARRAGLESSFNDLCRM
jgi:hypothetical protein